MPSHPPRFCRRSSALAAWNFFFHASSSFTASLLARVKSSSKSSPSGQRRQRRRFVSRIFLGAHFGLPRYGQRRFSESPRPPGWTSRGAANRPPIRRLNPASRECENGRPASALRRCAAQNPGACPPATRRVRRSQRSRRQPWPRCVESVSLAQPCQAAHMEIKMRSGFVVVSPPTWPLPNFSPARSMPS